MNLTHEVQISSESDAFTNSRMALANLLKKEGHEISDIKRDLELVMFQNLALFPDYLTSLSHTRGAGAAVLAKKSEFLSLGVDIEWSDRHLKAETQKFFRHPEDLTTQDLLELWTMKEAAFKALSPLGYPGVLVLSKIIIQNGKFWTNEKSECVGELETFKINHDDRELWLAVACIKKN